MKVLSSLLCMLIVVLYCFTALAADKVVVVPLGASSIGIIEEVDPTVTASVKDGVSWDEVTGIPVDFADDTDDDTTYSAGTGLTLAGPCFG